MEKSLNDNETFKINHTSLHEDHLRLILYNSWMQHCQTLSLKYYCISILIIITIIFKEEIVFSFCWKCVLLCVARPQWHSLKVSSFVWRLPGRAAKDRLSFSNFCQHCIVCCTVTVFYYYFGLFPTKLFSSNK